MELSRRSLLKTGAGAAALGTLAGCLSEPDSGDDGTNGGSQYDGYAAFFALWDWTQQVAGDELTVNNPVEAGEMGHGWDPPADLQRNIAETGFFVYFDIPEFDWAQDIAADLESEETMTLIDGMADMDADDLIPVDNHVWVDPVLAQTSVETIADALAAIDPDSEDVYEDNAAAYIDRIDEVDSQFEELAANAVRDTVVFAGHDSFRYVEERYGFEIYTPVGTSPDEAESLDDVSEMVSVINEHDIDTILYDPFETENPDDDIPNAVDVLLDETDATDSMPLSPAEGTTETWNDNEYGWVEQMTEVNIPALEAAFGTE